MYVLALFLHKSRNLYEFSKAKSRNWYRQVYKKRWQT